MEKEKYSSGEIKGILKNVTWSSRMHCTRGGKVYSSSAEEFLRWINEYTKYCRPDEVDNWNSICRDKIYNPLILKDGVECTPELQKLIHNREYEIVDCLFNFMDAGAIMKKYHDTNSWDEVEMLIKEQGHSGYMFSGMCNVMLRFSQYGVEFVDHFDPFRAERCQAFQDMYKKRSEEKRKQLNQRLVNVLYKKMEFKDN